MEKKNDVLFMCQYFYPEYISSAKLPYETAVALAESGLKVSAFVGYPKEYNNQDKKVSNYEEINGVYIERLNYLQLKRSSKLGRLTNYLSFTLSMLSKIKKVKDYKTIIVYSNPPLLPLVSVLAKKIFKTNIIFVSYDVYPEIAISSKVISDNGLIAKVMRIANNFIFKNIDAVVALSEEMKEFIKINRNMVKNITIEVIPNWTDESKLPRDKLSTRQKYFEDIKKEDIIISYLGNMGIAQDMETIMDGILYYKNNKSIKFLFAGHGNKMNELKEIKKREKLDNILILDYLHGDEFDEVLSISDVFLLSLNKSVNGLAVPSKTYTYMMAGKPIVAIIESNTDIAKDLKEYSAGYIINGNSQDSIVNVIQKLHEDVTLREKMGQNSRNTYLKKYTLEKGTNEYKKLLKKYI